MHSRFTAVEGRGKKRAGAYAPAREISDIILTLDSGVCIITLLQAEFDRYRHLNVHILASLASGLKVR